MSQLHERGIERSGVELEFDELWKPVHDAYKRYDKAIVAYPSGFPGDEPQIIYKKLAEPGVGELSDEEIFEKFVDLKTVTSSVARYIRLVSIRQEIEAAVGAVNDFLGFDPEQVDCLERAYTGGPRLYLRKKAAGEIYGRSNRKTVRLFGISADGSAAVVKRFGDAQEKLEEINHWSFNYSQLPKFEPTQDPGDYDVIPEVVNIDGVSFQ